jgi:hypothetical protein
MWFDDLDTAVVTVFLIAIGAVAFGGGAIGFALARLL